MSQELTAYLSVFNLFLTQRIMAILSKGCKPDNFEPHNSLKLRFTNIRGLPSNFINPSANVFVFGDFNVHHKDWLTYSGGIDRPGELCYNVYICLYMFIS